MADKKIKIIEHGPYKVSGNILLQKEAIVGDGNGISEKWKKGEKFPEKEEYSLCRCGKSLNKPYCDGTHTTAGFDCTETAEHDLYYMMIGRKFSMVPRHQCQITAIFVLPEDSAIAETPLGNLSANQMILKKRKISSKNAAIVLPED